MECDRVKKQFSKINFEPCCESCHEDSDMGYGEDLWFLDINGNMRHVCCSIGRELEGYKHGPNRTRKGTST
jgi:hypothetical protein